mgnify:CR=1 FL=1
MKKALPDIFRPLMWSYNFSKLNPEKHKAIIIRNAINYGTLGHWRWIINHYGQGIVKEILEKTPAPAIKPRAARLAQLVLGIENPQYASRNANTKR